jgi:hypothetical protein
LTRDSLFKRARRGDILCPFCDEEESIDYLFIHCDMVREFWTSFNAQNNTNISLPLVSIGKLWAYAGSLQGSKRTFNISLWSIGCLFIGFVGMRGIIKCISKRTLFLSILLFSRFHICFPCGQVFNIFLDYLCREEGIMTFIEAPEQRQNVLLMLV